MIINFITALALIWGGIMAVGAILRVLQPLTGDIFDAEDFVDYIRKGILPWAWLIARYWL